MPYRSMAEGRLAHSEAARWVRSNGWRQRPSYLLRWHFAYDDGECWMTMCGAALPLITFEGEIEPRCQKCVSLLEESWGSGERMGYSPSR